MNTQVGIKAGVVSTARSNRKVGPVALAFGWMFDVLVLGVAMTAALVAPGLMARDE
ncbi:MAG: hypothetical protein IBJ18_09580 [Phycisphaerales bacterium]|nr:hypothetical protein [Phycisphaerales bacterium]